VGGTVFTATDLYESLHNSVANETNGAQVPQLGSFDTDGDFLFITNRDAPVVNVDPKAHLHLTGVPEGATIKLDRVVYPGPNIDLDLRGDLSRSVELVVLADQYETYMATVSLQAGAETDLQIKLVPEPPVPGPQSVQPVQMDRPTTANDTPPPNIEPVVPVVPAPSAGPLVPPIPAPTGGPDASAVPTPPASTKMNPVDGAEMVYIPEGEFTMGNVHPPVGHGDEAPAHKVMLDGYYIYKNLVTVAMYKKFCDAMHRPMPDPPSWGWDDTSYPIVNVSWDDAKDYCRWAGTSLPTEAQWEKAARGGDARTYPWGDSWNPENCRYLRSYSDPNKGPSEVGSFSAGASPYGVMDMAGNVWEWCEDWYDDLYYAHSPERNPTGAASGMDHSLRGGSWHEIDTNEFRCTTRFHDAPGGGNFMYGFRCVARSGE
ncbi:MAG: formylglycine-generating enzyme family protein, partial [Capsulimonadaceae bacterium]